MPVEPEDGNNIEREGPEDAPDSEEQNIDELHEQVVGDNDTDEPMQPEDVREQLQGEEKPQEAEQKVRDQQASDQQLRGNYSDYPLTWDTGYMPSRGILYDREEIHARPIKVSEEKYLTTANMTNFDEAIRQVCQECIQTDFLDLTYGDKLWAYIRLRIETWSSTYYMAWTCPHCDHENSRYEYDLTQMDITYLDEDYYEPQKFSVEDDREFSMRMLRVRDEVEVDNFLSQEKSNNQQQGFADRGGQPSSFGDHSRSQLEVMARLSKMVEDCPGDASSITSTINWIENDASPKEFATIRSFADEYYHGLSFTAELECHSCSRTTERTLPFRPQLLYPDPDEIVDISEARVD